MTARQVFLSRTIDVSDYPSLREALSTVPRLPLLNTSIHYDAEAGAFLLGLVFTAEEAVYDDVLWWARYEGFGVIEPDQWKAGRRLEFAREINRFWCSEHTDPSHAPLVALIRQFERRAREGGALFKPQFLIECAEEVDEWSIDINFDDTGELAVPEDARTRIARSSTSPTPVGAALGSKAGRPS